MRAITLRNIPAEVQKAIRSKAQQKQISVNKAVIELLQERRRDVIDAAGHNDLVERAGVAPSALEAADLCVELPVYGMANSLNVAMAGTIALYDWRKSHGAR